MRILQFFISFLLILCSTVQGQQLQSQTILTVDQQRQIQQIRHLKTRVDSLLINLPPAVQMQMLYELGKPPQHATPEIKALRSIKPLTAQVRFGKDLSFLAVFDQNRDGILNAMDVPFLQAFRLWRDRAAHEKITPEELSDLQDHVQSIGLEGNTFVHHNGTVGAVFLEKYIVFDLDDNGVSTAYPLNQSGDGFLAIDADRLKGSAYALYSQWGTELKGVHPLTTGLIVKTPDGNRHPLTW